MRFLKQFVPVVAIAFLGGQAVGQVQGNAVLTLVLGLVTAVAAVVVYYWVVRWAEHRKPAEVGRNGAVWYLLLGMVIGAVWFGAVIANIYWLGDYRMAGWGTSAGPTALLGFMAAAAVTEELMFRGVLFRIMERRTGTWIALVASSALFGLYHMANQDATVLGAVAIAVEAGGTLAAAYAATRNLWVPIGLHFAWNFTEAGIFGTEVSGNGQSQGVLHSVLSGPTLITGGSFGPEESMYSIGLGVLLTIVFLWIAHRRGNLVPLRPSARVAPTVTLAK